MQILVVDQDPLPAQFIQSKLEPLGHKVLGETSKDRASALCKSQDFDLVIIDPSPLTSPRALVTGIHRNCAKPLYTILMSDSMTSIEDALKSGMNDVLPKPLNPETLDKKVENTRYFLELKKQMGDTSEDFPSAGGIIAKSAFNQLFLSAIDRANRYGEKTFLILVSLSNYSQIAAEQGPYAADQAVAKISQHLTALRRQTDIVGQTAPNEYTLLLQRPVYETEPMDAANRFTEALAKYDGFVSSNTENIERIELSVALTSIPTGEVVIKHSFELPTGQ